MTVWIYVNTSKQVGDPEHIKVFANRTPRKPGSRKTIPKAWPSSTRFWSEPDRPQDRLRHAQRPESKRAALARPLAGQICSE